MGRDQEIVRPFDGFTSGPAPVAVSASDLPPNIRLYGPRELPPAPPPIPTNQPVWPTVRMPDGSKVQLGPNGEMRPVP
jgi:hypothetical protein